LFLISNFCRFVKASYKKLKSLLLPAESNLVAKVAFVDFQVALYLSSFRCEIFNRLILFNLWTYISSGFLRIISFIILTICSSCGTSGAFSLRSCLSLRVCFESSFDYCRSLGAFITSVHQPSETLQSYLKPTTFVSLRHASSFGQFPSCWT
jgi:hypothetical protein